jgi:hypothetical protein
VPRRSFKQIIPVGAAKITLISLTTATSAPAA